MSDPSTDPDYEADHTIDPDLLSPAAVEVTRRLREAGYDALLVGGCVRDLLLGHAPKDYDVATNATPEQVERVFRRSRIVGRRFRIVHVRVGRDVVEVTTYRGAPVEVGEHTHTRSGRVLDDNVWGDLDSDAQRRDFTINALYYDPLTNEGIDHVDGLADLENRVLRIIGDPQRRFAEDPVRMLRAVRFVTKLGFSLEQETEQALIQSAHLITDVPPARLLDEVVKLFHSGSGAANCHLLQHYGILELLFPVLSPWLTAGERTIPEIILRALENTDSRVAQGKPVIAPFLFAALLWPPVKERVESLRHAGKPSIEALHRASDQTFLLECEAVAVPRRVSSVVREIWELEHRLAERRPRTIKGLLENRRFRAGYDFMLLRQSVGEREDELCQWWTEIQDAADPMVVEMISGLAGAAGKRRARRPRKRKPGQ